MTRVDASDPCWKGGGVMSTYETIMVTLTVMNIIMLAENLLRGRERRLSLRAES